MTPQELSKKESEEDWIVSLIYATMHEQLAIDYNSFVPLIVPFEQKDEKNIVPPLSQLLQIRKEQVPNIFVFHSYSEQMVWYPLPLNDVKKVSPRAILMWAMRSIIAIDLELWQEKTVAYEKKVEEDKEVSARETEQYQNDMELVLQA